MSSTTICSLMFIKMPSSRSHGSSMYPVNSLLFIRDLHSPFVAVVWKGRTVCILPLTWSERQAVKSAYAAPCIFYRRWALNSLFCAAPVYTPSQEKQDPHPILQRLIEIAPQPFGGPDLLK